MTIQLEREHRIARKQSALIVRAHSTCAGAHVEVGNLRLQREELPAFAERYQQQPNASMLASLAASAVNDIKGVLGPKFGLRIYAVEATASTGSALAIDRPVVALNLCIESPEDEQAVHQVVETWHREYAASKVRDGASLQITSRVVNWYLVN